MKKLLPAFVLSATLALLTGRARAQIGAGADSVRIEVQVKSETAHKEPSKDPKAAQSAPRTEDKTLEISVSGKAKSPETRTGHWAIYGHAAKGHEVTVVDSGDFKVEFPASGPQKVESKKVTITYTPEHMEGGGGGKGGKGAKPGKKADATGTRYAGYSVEVKSGDTVVGETSDPQGIKTEANK